MKDVIGKLAQFLIQQQIPGSNQYAGPPFRKYNFGDTPPVNFAEERDKSCCGCISQG